MKYEIRWRNKWLTESATTIEDMIELLQAAVDELRAMQASGVTLDDDGCQKDDYACLVTDDPAVAEEFGFLPPDPDDEEDFDQDELVEANAIKTA